MILSPSVPPSFWMGLAVLTALCGGVGFWLGFASASQSMCGDCAAKDRELHDLQAERHTLTRALCNWMRRAQQAESSLAEQIKIGAYRIPPEKAQRVLGEIFRPMGVPSTVDDVERERLAREARKYRALKSIDHLPRVFIDAENSPANDGFAAHELLTFCCEDRQ